MTRRSGTVRPKRVAAAIVAGWLLLIPAILASTGGQLFLPIASAISHGSVLPGAGDLLAAVHSAKAQPEDYGASGTLPESDTLSPELIAALTGPTGPGFDPTFGTGAGPLAAVPPGPLGLPSVMLDAYMRASQALAATRPDCGLHWSVLAAIGRIESNHARGGAVDTQGTTVRPILGPQLSGGPGVAAIRDSDGGALDGDTVWDRAVGPMQFIPTTWARYAVDGSNDGVASPHNIYDSTLAAGHYLCAGGGDLRNPVALAQAIFRYNHSEPYVANVLGWAAAYASGVTPLPSSPGLAEPVADLPPVAAAPGTTPPDTTTPTSTTTTTGTSTPTTTTTTTTTTTGTSTTTTTVTCPTAPTDPSTTTPTSVPAGCETTTTPPPPPPSTEAATQTQSETGTQSQTQAGSESATQTQGSVESPSAAESATQSTSDTAAAASTTTSLPAT